MYIDAFVGSQARLENQETRARWKSVPLFAAKSLVVGAIVVGVIVYVLGRIALYGPEVAVGVELMEQPLTDAGVADGAELTAQTAQALPKVSQDSKVADDVELTDQMAQDAPKDSEVGVCVELTEDSPQDCEFSWNKFHQVRIIVFGIQYKCTLKNTAITTVSFCNDNATRYSVAVRRAFFSTLQIYCYTFAPLSSADEDTIGIWKEQLSALQNPPAANDPKCASVIPPATNPRFIIKQKDKKKNDVKNSMQTHCNSPPWLLVLVSEKMGDRLHKSNKYYIRLPFQT